MPRKSEPPKGDCPLDVERCNDAIVLFSTEWINFNFFITHFLHLNFGCHTVEI